MDREPPYIVELTLRAGRDPTGDDRHPAVRMRRALKRFLRDEGLTCLRLHWPTWDEAKAKYLMTEPEGEECAS